MLKIMSYIKTNIFFTFFCFFFIFSAILVSTTGIDICIPCLWKTIFGIQCPGCGLTTALISLMELDYKKALESNWLIYLFVPFGVYYITKDYIKFKRKYNA